MRRIAIAVEVAGGSSVTTLCYHLIHHLAFSYWLVMGVVVLMMVVVEEEATELLMRAAQRLKLRLARAVVDRVDLLLLLLLLLLGIATSTAIVVIG